MSDAYAKLARQLDYRFKDYQLLTRALTHRSKGGSNNERLEFLGDSILSFVIAAELFERFPRLTEGELTRVRASLVKQETLARIARDLGLGAHLTLGSGEYKSGGHDRDSILSDAVEAVLAAIYLDGGFVAVHTAIRHVYAEKFAQIDPDQIQKDPKTRLQEWLQQRALGTPTYNVVTVAGEAHNQNFIVECIVPGLAEPIPGEGTSRRNAEQQAARRAFERLGDA